LTNFFVGSESWQHFREIPEWIDSEMKSKGVTANMAISTLEEMRKVPDKSVLLGMNTLSSVLASQRKKVCYIFRRTFTEMLLILFLV
jgi:hypothetical protein